MNSRRQFLRTAATSTAGCAALSSLPFVSAQEQSVTPDLVQLDSGIEPLVRLLEDSPRDELLERVAAKIRDGVSYREVLAALLLAGVRNVQPRPSVGFKFHAVLVVHSAHLASLSSPAGDRWLPIFWALDYFKAKQLEERRASGWRMQPVVEAKVPSPAKARGAFIEAMDRWDVEAADGAIAALARSAGADEVFELLYRYAARDYRSIGHKAIYVANTARALQCIGWRHAEPALRSLTFALLNHNGEPNPSQSDLGPDRAWRKNEGAAKSLGAGWRAGKVDPAATRDLLTAFRDGDEFEAAAAAAKTLGDGAGPQTIWDAVFVGGGELLMRQPGIIGLHSMTTANALRHAYQWCGDDLVRRRILLQACSFLPKFRDSAAGRGKLGERTIDDIANDAKQYEAETTGDEQFVSSIFADVGAKPLAATAKTQAFLQNGGAPADVINTARQLVFMKGRDAHDYKFSSAVLEDYYHVSPAWRPAFLGLSSNYFRGAGARDSGLVQRTREALK